MAIVDIAARNIPLAYVEGLWKFRVFSGLEDTRNGEAMVMIHPTVLTIEHPEERVMTDPVRDCNPFFHVMEFVWMMAGSNDVKWIAQFNKRMLDYADDGYLRGAYGWRWANPSPQLSDTVDLLRGYPETRQAVLAMWDPVYDGSRAKTSDRPCHTHIYFRVRESTHLDMTVMNRSNDYVWGMMGTNAVHFTLLHELIARASGYKLGKYMVFSNNLHIYKDVPRFNEIWNTYAKKNIYQGKGKVEPFPILNHWLEFTTFMVECNLFFHGESNFSNEWLQYVAYPMKMAYLESKNREEWISQIAALDWKLACIEWSARRSDDRWDV